MGATNDKVAGKAKELSGKVTGDRDLESRGKGQHAVGAVKDAADEVAGEFKDKVEDLKRTVKDVKDRAAGS